eukprot:CAMPEP_0116872160 /NCGR_PEP_ID=MMETSP0463-20121206/2846_1 /TAXON_ID=181622 /ORGANISM="Strombidinopsis sp, Strain SopsisLIS2011" /LENGTH=79 /DNA_ID=CAMNT_0004511975 /DNA_START=5727 /DNA_END=5966 /DNA_ORIENTATION=-
MLNFKHDVNAFIQNDSFEKLATPVADLVTVVGLDSLLFKDFVQSYVKPLVLEMDERINNDDMWMKINYQLLLKTRNTSW